jgi:hypothetical protein
MHEQRRFAEKDRLRGQRADLGVAPPDPYGQAMASARAAADAQSLMRGRQLQDAERTRRDLLFRSQTEPNYGQYMGSSAQTFGHMLPAYQMHGIDVMGGRGTGWDQYAGLAQAGQLPDQMGAQWLLNQYNSGPQGAQT